MILSHPTRKDIDEICDLRLAYLKDDLGQTDTDRLRIVNQGLPVFLRTHIGKDLMSFVDRENGEIIACAFVFISEDPVGTDGETEKNGTLLNVFTRKDFRKQGRAARLVREALNEAKRNNISVTEEFKAVHL